MRVGERAQDQDIDMLGLGVGSGPRACLRDLLAEMDHRCYFACCHQSSLLYRSVYSSGEEAYLNYMSGPSMLRTATNEEWERGLACALVKRNQKKMKQATSEKVHTRAAHAATRAGCCTPRTWLLFYVRSTHNKQEPQVLQETLTCHKHEATQTSAAS